MFSNDIRYNQKELGVSIVETLVTLAISGIVMTGLLTMYTQAAITGRDHSIRIATFLEAQAALQMMGSELRMMGNGVPFDQANFQIGEDTLSDPSVTEPIVVATATNTNISFRINESGGVFLLTEDFNPIFSTTIKLTELGSLGAGDPIYLSNSVVSGDDGLYAVIATVDSGTSSITIDPGYVGSPNSVFPMGSILEEVPVVTYSISADGNDVTRDSGSGPVVISGNSTLSLDYLDHNGAELTLPITNAMVVDELRSIRLTIQHRSKKKLSDGNYYTTTASQVFGIRNLNYLF